MSRRLRFLLTVALVAVAALALGASAAFAGPKEIAYVCKGEDICLLDPDNPGATFNLTDDGTTSYESDPVWSPDGKKLAFVAHFLSPASEDIYTMEPEGLGQTFNLATQVTHFVGVTPLSEIAWSPDGTKIAFLGGASPGSSPIDVVNADGTSAGPTVVSAASGGGGTPSWSPDSAKIAYWHGNQIYTVPADASSPAAPLPGATCTEPAWSPDGSKIACGREFHNVQIFGPTGGAPLTTITNNSQFGFLSWSPSGAQLAYHETIGENSFFHVVNADGSNNHALPIVEHLNANGPAPSWSPDGSRLVFQGYNFGAEPPTNEVYIANADGSGAVTALTSNQGYATEPAWRPNPVAHPGPQVITPSGATPGPLPGPTVKPTIKWFTNRVFISPGAHYIPPLSVGCSAPRCNIGGTGTSKGAIAAGVLSHQVPAATASAKKKPKKKKPKSVLLASGKVTLTANQKGALNLKLTKAGMTVLAKLGKVKMVITVTVTSPGQPTFKESRTVEVVVRPKKKGR